MAFSSLQRQTLLLFLDSFETKMFIRKEIVTDYAKTFIFVTIWFSGKVMN